MLPVLYNVPLLLVLILLCLIGQTLLIEKHRVTTILFIISALIGLSLGSHGKALDPTEYVVPLSVFTLGLLVAFQVELTLVGYALMAIVIGFFHGHNLGVSLEYADSLMMSIVSLILYAGLVTVAIERIYHSLTNPNIVKILGGVIGLIGLLLFFL